MAVSDLVNLSGLMDDAKCFAVNRLATVTPPNFALSALTRSSKMDFGWDHYRRRL